MTGAFFRTAAHFGRPVTILSSTRACSFKRVAQPPTTSTMFTLFHNRRFYHPNLGGPTLRPTTTAAPCIAYQGVTVDTHTMGASLPRYLGMKVHPLVDSFAWTKLVVVGQHDRNESVIGREKTDKPFNWQRPTAKRVDEDLHIRCFPGIDHVEHYAALLATHIRLTKGSNRALDVLYHPVQEGETIRALKEETNLLAVPQADVILIGLVHRLADLTGHVTFEGGASQEFAWLLKEFGPQKKRVLFLGCRFSFWGSISGDLVRVLTEHTGAKEIIYFGKLGTTRPDIQPNRWLASGSTSSVLGQIVTWRNVLEPTLRRSDIPIVFGKHETLSSVLFETKDWLSRSTSDFVDPEVGCMALAAVQSGIQFGYLHAISDNVARKYDEDLSNEREEGVLHGRENLYSVVNGVLRSHLESF